MPDNWQPISTAPKDGSDILLFIPDYQRKVWIGDYTISEHFSRGKSTYRREGWNIGGGILSTINGEPNPTRWQPLPAPPSEEE